MLRSSRFCFSFLRDMTILFSFLKPLSRQHILLAVVACWLLTTPDNDDVQTPGLPSTEKRGVGDR